MSILDERLTCDEGSLGIMLGGKSFGKTFMVKALKQRMASNEKAFNEEQERLRKKAFDLRNDASTQQALADDPNTSFPEREQAENKEQELRTEADTIENEKTSRANELMPRRLVIYDARRKGSDITQGIIASLIDQAPATFTSMSAFLPALAGTTTTVAGSLMGGAELNALSKAAEAAEAVSKAIGNASALEAVLDAYVRTCANEGVFPCLALDELNMALPSSTEEERARTLKTLQLLVLYSKQEEQMNILLSASEQMEPFRRSALGFNSSHFSYTMLVSDVPPAAMRALLMKEWGMGQHLADAVMAVWGGKILFFCSCFNAGAASQMLASILLFLLTLIVHNFATLFGSYFGWLFAGHVWGAKTGLLDLASRRREYRAISNLILNPREGKRGALACAQAAKMGTIADMSTFLADLAQKGYARYTDELDPRVVMGTARDACAVVMDDAITPSLHVC